MFIKEIITIVFVFAILLSQVSTVFAVGNREELLSFIPSSDGYVLDQANIFSNDEELELEIAHLKSGTGFEIGIITTDNIEKFTSIEEYSVLVYEKWGIGSNKDNGLLLVLVKDSERETGFRYRLEIGYGAEGVFTDGVSGFILDQYMIPQFKLGDYNRGISVALGEIVDLVNSNEELHFVKTTEDINYDKISATESIISVAIIIAVIIIILVIIGLISSKTGIKLITADLIFTILRLIFQILIAVATKGKSTGGSSFGGGKSGGGGASR